MSPGKIAWFAGSSGPRFLHALRFVGMFAAFRWSSSSQSSEENQGTEQ